MYNNLNNVFNGIYFCLLQPACQKGTDSSTDPMMADMLQKMNIKLVYSVMEYLLIC